MISRRVLALDRREIGGGVATRRRFEFGDQRRSRVLWIQIDVAALQCFHRDLRAAEIELRPIDVEPTVFEDLRVHLTEDQLFREIFRSDGDARTGGRTAPARERDGAADRGESGGAVHGEVRSTHQAPVHHVATRLIGSPPDAVRSRRARPASRARECRPRPHLRASPLDRSPRCR